MRVRWRRHRADERSGVSVTCGPARGLRVPAPARCRYRASGPSRVARAAAGWHAATPAAPGADEAAGPILAGWTMIEVFDTTAARIALGRRMLGCPACDQPLRPWGHARERTIRDLGGALLTIRPDRALCTGCGASHVLLDAGLLPRRAYAAGLIGQALVASALGHGHRPIAAGLAVPAGTARGWIRGARRSAPWLRV